MRLFLGCLVTTRRVADLLQLRWHGLLGVLQDLDEVTCMGFLVLRTLGLWAEKAHGHALLACTSSTADPVDVILDRERECVVDNKLHILHIEASTGDVGGDQRRLLARLEVGNGLCPRGLSHVALKGNCLAISVLLQEGLEPSCLSFVEAEDDYLLVRREVLLQVLKQSFRLLPGVPEHLNFLTDCSVRHKTLVHGANAHMHGILEELSGQVVHRGWPCGTEHASLALSGLGHPADEGLDDVDEAHIEHPICLVEDEVLHVAQVESALVREVLQTSWRRHQHVDPLLL
mmetsp:Transcript_78501/g.198121  ORF Transcript_78501/g.198121 Transcript_78501/m.198121 type:complete len:288 (+) Transcript_78501:373-1236(+)